MGIVIWQLYRELVPLRREVQNLRAQVGVLTVDDDTKIHVVEVKEAGSFQWNWRVRLPAGHDYWLCASQRVPANGIATHTNCKMRLGMGGREFNIRVRVVPAETGDRWVYLESPNNDSPILDVESTKWVNGEAMLSMDVTGREGQESSKVDEPVVLLRMREEPPTSESSNGVLLWITNRR